MATKVTFTLDEGTIEKLGITAERLRKPKSQVVREAIAEYHDRAGKLSEEERRRLLRALDEMLPGIRPRSARAVASEIESVREARRAGGRRSR
ncbi:MAG TPA: ribbon-helix-helix protein, CopG family [Thermoanaerobaculia bacterium]|nr:ribbon-helix-helix protein, CopG family [Thermoanaerobaculia bacterium]